MHSQERFHLSFIDGLRGIAIVSVALHHWGTYVVRLPNLSDFSKRMIFAGKEGVLLFFLVSAFTLYRSFHMRQGTESSPFRNFYLRRIFRILPLWWVAVIFYGYQQGHSFEKLFIHFSMMFGFFSDRPFLFGGEWSLFVEESFYLLLPFTVLLSKTLRGTLILLVGALFIRTLWLSLDIGETPNFMGTFPIAVWYAFVLGILLLHIYENKALLERLDRPRERALLNVASIALPLLLCGLGEWGESDLLSAIGLFALFLGAMSPKTLVGRLTRQRWLGQYGIFCYAIYLFHIALLNSFRDHLVFHSLFGNLGVVERFYLCTALFLLANWGLGWLIFNLFEKPIIQFGKRTIAHLESKGARIKGFRRSAEEGL